MIKNCFKTKVIRRHLIYNNVLVIQGYYLEGEPEKIDLVIYVNGVKTEYKYYKTDKFIVRRKYIGISSKINTEIMLEIECDDLSQIESFEIINNEENEMQKALVLDNKKIKEILEKKPYHIDEMFYDKNSFVIKGWLIYNQKVDFYLQDKKLRRKSLSPVFKNRQDVNEEFYEADSNGKYGFEIKTKKPKNAEKLCIEFDDAIITESLVVEKRVNKTASHLNRFNKHIKTHGYKKTLIKIIKKLKGKISNKNSDSYIDYDKWIEVNEEGIDKLEKQKKHKFKKNIKFSIITALFNTNIEYLEILINALKEQTYENWEMCFADGSTNDILKEHFEKNHKDDYRIKYIKLDGNLGISGNTNSALAIAKGDYFVFIDHDDVIPINTLYELACEIEEDEKIDFIYSDEDKISMDGKLRFQPHFKPDFNIDLLRSVNYICHLFVVKKDLANSVGLFNSEFDGAQDYDYILRCVENAGRIKHIPKILYHWRSHKESTAENPESKLYAFEAGKRAIDAHLSRMGYKGKTINGPAYGLYHVIFEVEKEELISIIIPNKDHIEDLEKCIDSIINKTIYKNYEIIIVENNSVEDSTFEYYKRISKEHENVKVIYWKDKFNYSLINNFATEHAKGKYYLFLNNDTEIMEGTWIQEMLSYCQREDVGIVGARLLYPDDTIQHAGVIIGYGGIAGHAFIGLHKDDYGYFARQMCTQNYSAVTAACLMIKRDVFEKVKGFTKELEVAFNDIDLCLKVRKLGYLIVYNPYVTLYHYESKSRGLEDTPEKIKRFNNEVEIFYEKWASMIEEGDPYYNKNLSLERSDFGLKK